MKMTPKHKKTPKRPTQATDNNQLARATAPAFATAGPSTVAKPAQSAADSGTTSATTSRKFAFTKKQLDSLALPTTGWDVYNDEGMRGLQLHVFASGTKTFFLYRKIKRKPERIHIGRYPDLTLEQARKEAQRLNGAIAQGLNPAEEKRTLRHETTFEELFDKYLEEHAKRHKRTWKADANLNRLYFASLRKRKISSITKADLIQLHSLIGRHAKYNANRALALLSKMFNFARDCGWKGENPASGVKRFAEEKRERFLDGDELPAFFRSLAQEPNTTLRDYFIAAILTGARSRVNLCTMRWDEIRWSRQVWEIPSTKSKNKKPMQVILVPLMIALLRKRATAEDADPVWVFPGRKGLTTKGHLVQARIAFGRILKRAGIRDCRMHDLRRTLGSWQAMQGASLVIIGASLGHDSLEATKIYARLNTDPVRASVEQATTAILAAAGELPAGVLPALPALPAKIK